MALPANLSTGNVAGLLQVDGVPCAGAKVTFTPQAKVLYDTTATPKAIVGIGAQTATCNTDGTFSKDLVATDDPDNGIVGFTWHVEFSGGNPAAAFPAFDMYVPGGVITNIADAAKAAVAASTGQVVIQVIGGGSGGGGGGGGVTDHGALTGLGDDDHPQYLNTTRGDGRYQTLTAAASSSAADRQRVNHSGQMSSLNVDYLKQDGITTVTVEDELDALESSISAKAPYDLRIWTPAVGSTPGSWSARPTLPTGVPAIANSSQDVNCTTPPPGAQVGDRWKPHPQAVLTSA